MPTITYRITFDRIGRNHNAPPIAITVADDYPADAIAKQVFHHVLPRVASRVVNIDVELADNLRSGTGTIFCGFQVGGTFTVTATLVTDDEVTADGGQV